MLRKLVCAISAVTALAGAGNAAASLIFQIHPIALNVAEIRATGQLDVATGSAVRIALDGATTTGNSGVADSFTGNFTLGGQAPDFVFVRGATDNLVISFPSPLAVGAIPAGTLTVTLDVESFLPIGTMGNVTVDGIPSTVLGTFAVVNAFAVPEPATLALIGLGLAGLGFARRRRPR